MQRARVMALSALALCTVVCSWADGIYLSGPGGSIPSTAPQAAAGSFVSSIRAGRPGTVAGGNAVTVILKGLQHGWSGDLVATLSYVDSQGNIIRSATLFSRIGQTVARPSGAWATFGYANSAGDNYSFNSDFGGDLHATAAALGFADWVPGEQSDPVGGFRFFTCDDPGVRNDFSYAFAGLDLASGSWQLTITDVADHKGQAGSIVDFGSLVGWELQLQVAPPDVSSDSRIAHADHAPIR